MFTRRTNSRGRRQTGSLNAVGGASSAAATSTPLTIISSTTVNMWQRSDLDVTDSGSGTASAWGDQTANNRDWVQGGATSIQPTINAGGPGGKQYLSLDGVDDYMTNAYSPALGFLWIIARRTIGSAAFIINGSVTGSRRFSLYSDTATNLRQANATQGHAATMNTGIWYRAYCNFTNSVSDEIRCGTPAATTGSINSGTSNAATLWLGCTGILASFWNGDLLEIMHCAAKPDAGELAALDAYVTATWGGLVQI